MKASERGVNVNDDRSTTVIIVGSNASSSLWRFMETSFYLSSKHYPHTRRYRVLAVQKKEIKNLYMSAGVLI
jgi:hypothetical protein